MNRILLSNYPSSSISPNPTNNLFKSHKSLMRIRKKSLGLVVDRNAHKIKNKKQKQINNRDDQYQQIRFLKDIIQKKKQVQDYQILKKSSRQQTVRSISKDYDYYDMVVRDLISQIKLKQSKKVILYPSPIPKRKINSTSNMNQDDKFKRQKDFTLRTTQCTIKFSPKRDNMIFRMNQFTTDTIYQKKITSYIEFLYKINFSNMIYIDLNLNSNNNNTIYKVKVGKGNNGGLIKSLLKRRFWLEIVNQEGGQFIWTQGTQHQTHYLQSPINRKEDTIKKFKKKSVEQYTQKIMPRKQYKEAQNIFVKSQACQSPYPTINPQLVTNHLPQNYIIGSKKSLFMLMHWYYKQINNIDPFIHIPKTYHIKSFNDDSWKQFWYQNYKKQQTWIIKPGQNTNRGTGIKVATTSNVSKLLKKQTHQNGQQKTYIIQQYLQPFLYQSRKFDIRHYLMITSVNGLIKGYWYNDGYIRTSSQLFDLHDIDNPFIHLTNDAIQKKSQYYGKYQPGNKLSYAQFQRYLDSNYPHKKYNFQQQIINKMKNITIDIIRASFKYIDPDRRGHNFQLFGLDFMVDNKFKPYLIQVNANPCLETSCPLLNRIIPVLAEHTLRLGLDPLFPPPQHYPPNLRYQLSDRLIFDQKYQGQYYRDIFQNTTQFQIDSLCQLSADLEIYQDDGTDNNKQIDLFEEGSKVY